MKVSFVIPCYRSEHTIGKVVDKIENTIRKDDECEIILVNDCSPDDTFETIRGLCEKWDNVKGISLAKNFGQHAALMAGFRHVTGGVVVCLDDDGQTPPEEVYKLLDKLDENTDVVYAEYEQKKHSIFRNMGSKINSKMTEYLIGKPKNLFVSSYFAARRYIIDEIIKYENPYPYVIGLILRATKNIKNAKVNHHAREEGQSGYSFKKLIRLWLNGFTAFSVKPLRIATALGLVFAFLGFAYAIYTVINKFINPNVPVGWSSMMAAFMVIGGCILFMLGLIGEYIGRIYISINNSPQYVIRDVIGYEGEGNEKDRNS